MDRLSGQKSLLTTSLGLLSYCFPPLVSQATAVTAHPLFLILSFIHKYTYRKPVQSRHWASV